MVLAPLDPLIFKNNLYILVSLKKNLLGKYYFARFTDEDTVTQRG